MKLLYKEHLENQLKLPFKKEKKVFYLIDSNMSRLERIPFYTSNHSPPPPPRLMTALHVLREHKLDSVHIKLRREQETL